MGVKCGVGVGFRITYYVVEERTYTKLYLTSTSCLYSEDEVHHDIILQTSGVSQFWGPAAEHC
jgi:hypothetical protein